jgi:hypothetical protein
MFLIDCSIPLDQHPTVQIHNLRPLNSLIRGIPVYLWGGLWATRRFVYSICKTYVATHLITQNKQSYIELKIIKIMLKVRLFLANKPISHSNPNLYTVL